jgi:hypothetical protein
MLLKGREDSLVAESSGTSAIPVAEPDVLESVASRNQHVADAIRAYCRFPYPQRYALMVNGKWGSGKTHLLQNVAESLIERGLSGDSDKPLYITLYGVKHPDEIAEQLYQQMHPFLASKGVRLVGALLKGALKASFKVNLDEIHKEDMTLLAQFPDVKASDVLGRTAQRVVVFDDFERAAMPSVELLGYINPLVEHDGCKVIILANEEIIEQDDAYKERKEKTIGQTLYVTADVGAAFDSFLTEIDTEGLKTFYLLHRKEIQDLFVVSRLDNLRLLKQFLWDFEKFWNVLIDEQHQNDKAMLEIMLLLCVWTFEIRSHRLDSEAFDYDQVNVAMALARNKPDERYRSFAAMVKTYPSVAFQSTLLTRSTIKGMILSSEFSAEGIRAQLSVHPYFAKAEETPSWRLLWHSHILPEQDIPEVMRRFDEDFENRRYTEDGEVMHIAGLCLWISDIGQPGWPADTVIARLEKYIDDVYAERPGSSNDVLPASTLHLDFGGAYGLGYRYAGTPRFNGIATYLGKMAGAWRQRGLPLLAKELLDLLARDSDAFLRQVCVTAAGPSTYARHPVMIAIAPDDLVAAFVSQNAEGRKDIMVALAIRYEHLHIHPGELIAERPWMREVYTKLTAYLNSLDPIPRAALKERVEHFLKDIVPQPDDSGAEPSP